jgi:hypothetical protein
MHGVFAGHKFASVATTTYAIQKAGPLKGCAERYFIGTAEWISGRLEETGALSIKSEWDDLFDPLSTNFILRRADFYACMLEMQTIATLNTSATTQEIDHDFPGKPVQRRN